MYFCLQNHSLTHVIKFNNHRWKNQAHLIFLWQTRFWSEPARMYFKKYILLFVFMSILGLRKNPIPKNGTESSTKPELKLIKYPNYSKFWYLENWNQILYEPKYIGYPNVSEIDIYIYILFLDLMYIKTSRIYLILLSWFKYLKI